MIHYLDEGLLFSRAVHTDFADKIEQASDGKLNVLGLYQGVMELNEVNGVYFFPGVALKVLVETLASEPFHEMTVMVFFDEELLFKSSASDEDLGSAPATEGDDEGGGLNAYWFNWIATVPARLIRKDVSIRVRVRTELGVMAGGALNIKLMPPLEVKSI